MMSNVEPKGGLTQEDKLWLILEHGISNDSVESEEDICLEGSATVAKRSWRKWQANRNNLVQLKTKLELHGVAAPEIGKDGT
jgi:hypothetical protein